MILTAVFESSIEVEDDLSTEQLQELAWELVHDVWLVDWTVDA